MDLDNKYIQPECHKRHHYVPVCYLKNFTLDGEIAWIYNKGVSKSYPKNINDIFVLENFYTIDESLLPKEHTEEVNPLSLELNYFARDIESQYTQFLNIFIPFIDESTPKSVCKDFAFQNVRKHTSLSGILSTFDVTLREFG